MRACALRLPSPGTPGEGWGEGQPRQRDVSATRVPRPSPSPLPSPRSTGRGRMRVPVSSPRPRACRGPRPAGAPGRIADGLDRRRVQLLGRLDRAVERQQGAVLERLAEAGEVAGPRRRRGRPPRTPTCTAAASTGSPAAWGRCAPATTCSGVSAGSISTSARTPGSCAAAMTAALAPLPTPHDRHAAARRPTCRLRSSARAPGRRRSR